jgi:DNA cross-link repair 1A protein
VLYGVPYSEHSSFRELRAFVAGLPARRVVPTVGGGARGKVELLTARP